MRKLFIACAAVCVVTMVTGCCVWQKFQTMVCPKKAGKTCKVENVQTEPKIIKSESIAVFKQESEKPKSVALESKPEEIETKQEAVQGEKETAIVAALQLGGMIDDFNAGTKPNKLGGDLGAWDRDPNDQTQSCRMAYDSAVKNGEGGFSVRLDYDVESPNPAYNGFWMKLENLDASKYKNLVFYVKGDAEKGFSPQFKVELKNAGSAGKYLVTGVTDSWQKIVIPLDKFAGLSDRSAVTEFVIVFDDITCAKKTGTINIDDVYLE